MTSNFSRITKFEIDELAASKVMLPDREAPPEIIILLANLGLINLSLNLFWCKVAQQS